MIAIKSISPSWSFCNKEYDVMSAEAIIDSVCTFDEYWFYQEFYNNFTSSEMSLPFVGEIGFNTFIEILKTFYSDIYDDIIYDARWNEIEDLEWKLCHGDYEIAGAMLRRMYEDESIAYQKLIDEKASEEEISNFIKNIFERN